MNGELIIFTQQSSNKKVFEFANKGKCILQTTKHSNTEKYIPLMKYLESTFGIPLIFSEANSI